ncbi:hypothetical protein FAM09_18290 [Niastella caeni]|uniref:Uncharacterized protein n=1 Tax=Niastella caeni TaxID=2569763 RepID=A0A4S8HNR0_9BACT|nr:hypothetical protein [Niastella caeni]THU36913.1 hypothetical protein FAM09_18290 [Niastella caeni]
MAKASRDTLREVSLAPLKKFAKDIKDQNAILNESYSKLAGRITTLQKRISKSTNADDIERYAKNLELMKKAAAKHPGNPANFEKGKSGGGGGKDGKSGGGLLGSVAGLFKADGLLGKESVGSFLKTGVKLQEDLVKIPVKDRTAADKANLERSGLSATATETDTVGKKFEKFKEKLQMGIGDVALSFMPLLDKLLGFGNTLIDTLLPQIMQFAQPIMDILNSLPLEDILGNIMKVITAILAAVGPIIEELKPLFDALFESFNPLLQSVGGLIIALVEGLGPILSLIVHIAVAILGPVVKGLAKAFSWLVDIVTAIVKFVSPIIEFITRAISMIVDGVMKMFGLGNKKNGTTGFYRDEKKDVKSSVTVTEAVEQKNSGLLKVAKSESKTEVNTQANKTAGSIASGGPRVININGVKFADKIEMHVLSAKEGFRDLEVHMQEMFLRILNSGAAIK